MATTPQGEFISAAEAGKLDTVIQLLRSGKVDINAKEGHWTNALGKAAHNGKIEVVRYLLEQGADPNPPTVSRSPRSCATSQGYDNIARLLLLAEIKAGSPATREWVRLGEGKLIHVEFLPDNSRKLTEIFNLQSRQMLTISENLTNNTEINLPAVSFDELSPALIDKILEKFAALEGVADENFVRTGKSAIEKSIPGA